MSASLPISDLLDRRSNKTPVYEASRRGMVDDGMKHITAFLQMDGVTEVCINRPGELWFETREGWFREEIPELTLEKLETLAKAIANYNFDAIDTKRPMLSATLPDGERIQIVIHPAVEKGTISYTIRRPSFIDLTIDELEEFGTFGKVTAIDNAIKPFELELMQLKNDGKIREFFELAIASKRNIVIVGATGSGKTTVTKSLIRLIPKHERLVTIEDVRELFMTDYPNKVHLLYARDDERGTNVTSKQALAACLRMKPDRILLSELRGDEAWEYIKSINTGHAGSITTMHANGAFEAFEQMTAFIKDSSTGAHLDTSYILHRLYTTIDVLVFFDRLYMREIFYDPEFKRNPELVLSKKLTLK